MLRARFGDDGKLLFKMQSTQHVGLSQVTADVLGTKGGSRCVLLLPGLMGIELYWGDTSGFGGSEGGWAGAALGVSCVVPNSAVRILLDIPLLTCYRVWHLYKGHPAAAQ